MIMYALARIRPSLEYLIALAALLVISGCAEDKTLLEEIKERKELRVVTRNSPTTYYIGPFGPQGLEHDLTNLFAREIGVKPKLVVEENLNQMFNMVKEGRADIAAAGLTITHLRQSDLYFGPSYQEVTQQLVYRSDTDSKRPKNIEDVIGSDIDIVAHSSHAETLTQLKSKHPELSWHEHEEMDSEDILELVRSQFTDYAVADSNEIKLVRRFMPELAVAFDLKPPEKIAWAMKQDIDDSLHIAVSQFFSRIKNDGTLKQLINKYFGHIRKFSYVGTRTYMRDIAQKLPKYIDAFKLGAWEYDLDWRLLAAIGYQESRWDPKAVSPTGVRGIMMLTQDTAKHIGIQDRVDPEQSIQGGANYIRQMLNKIPPRIQEPDRTWLALAAYNVGFGHLEDARIITARLGNDPDKWVDVRESLPLLSKPKWYKKTRNGYARGREPVDYVANIRNYYELLIWHTDSGSDAYSDEEPIPGMINSPAL